MKRKSILFFYNTYTSFVRTDFEMLSSVYQVRKYEFKPVHGLFNTGIELIRQFLFLVMHIWKYDAVFVWFADYHSLLPVVFAKVFGKKSFVVIGGYEVCRMESLHYGALCSKFRGFFCIQSMQWCTLNFTVSKYIDRKVKYIASASQRKLVPNCVDFVHPGISEVKENLVLTVGIIQSQRSFLLKGIDTFIEVARCRPDYQFVIVGMDKSKLSELLSDISPNVTIYGRMAHNELPAFYARARFYCQLSRSESFGVSIAEGMLHGCIPIVTHEGGMPELVGETGFVVPRDPAEISQLIAGLGEGRTDLYLDGARRIADNFSFAKRKEILAASISELIKE